MNILTKEQIIDLFCKINKKTQNDLIDVTTWDELDKTIKFLFSQNPCSVLDIGGGRNTSFRTKFTDYYALDLEKHKDTQFIYGDITSSDLQIDKTFDFIITKDTFEHILNPWDSVNNILSLLNEGGVFICIVPFNWRFHPVPYDCYRYSHQGLKYLFQHKNKMEHISSGYIKKYDSVEGFWKNKKDFWPFSNNFRHKDCVLSYFVGMKREDFIFDVKQIQGDFSFDHT